MPFGAWGFKSPLGHVHYPYRVGWSRPRPAPPGGRSPPAGVTGTAPPASPGRRVPVYRGFAIFQLVVALPTWWIMSTGNISAIVAAISVALGVGAWSMFGASGALLPELFGASHRYMGVSTAREFSAVVAGGLVPLIGALLLGWFENSWIPSPSTPGC